MVDYTVKIRNHVDHPDVIVIEYWREGIGGELMVSDDCFWRHQFGSLTMLERMHCWITLGVIDVNRPKAVRQEEL